MSRSNNESIDNNESIATTVCVVVMCPNSSLLLRMLTIVQFRVQYRLYQKLLVDRCYLK